MRPLFILTFLTIFTTIKSQEWINFTSTTSQIDLVEKGNFIWAATFGGLIQFDKTTHEQNLLTATNSDLPSNAVYTLDKDSQGNIWIGTYSGLAKFDGNEWVIYNKDNSDLPANQVYKLKIDKDDNIWIVSKISDHANYFSKFDQSNWTVYSEFYDEYPTRRVTDIEIIKDTVYLGLNFGLLKLVNGNFEYYDADNSDMIDNSISKLTSNNNDELIASYKHNDVGILSNNSWTSIGLPGNFGASYVETLEFDSFGNTLYLAYSENLYKYKDGIYTQVESNNEPFSPEMNASELIVGSNDNIWLTTYPHKGLFSNEYWEGLTNFDGLDWHNYPTTSSELRTNKVKSVIYDDNSDKIWVSMSYAGIVSIKNGNWTLHTPKNSTGSLIDVHNIIQNPINNEIWTSSFFSSYPTLCRYKNNEWTCFDSEDFNFNVSSWKGIMDLEFDPNGNLWVCHDNGLFYFDGQNWIERNDLIPFELPLDRHSITFDNDGNIWIAASSIFSEGGIVKWENGDSTIYDYSNTNQFLNFTKQIFYEREEDLLWVNTHFGLIKFDGTEWTIFDENNSDIPGKNIQNIWKDAEGNLWISTTKGIGKFDKTNWTNYTMANSGLPDNQVNTIAIDSYGNHWIGTERGGLAVFNESGVVSIHEEKSNFKQKSKIFPNPNNGNFSIQFCLEKTDDLMIKLFDSNGQMVFEKYIKNQPKGKQILKIQNKNLTPGIYLCQLKSNHKIESLKLLIHK